MSDTQTIKDYVLNECGMDLVGVADVRLLADESPFHRPEDILPGAKSIVVYGRRMPDGGVQAAFRAIEDGNFFARTSYNAYCADLASNFTLFFRTFDLCQYMERSYGYITAPLPCGAMQAGVPSSVPVPAFAEPFKVGLPLNIEKAAYAAGLGDYGWSGRLLTPEYGPRIQFGAVLTTMPLDADAPYDGVPLCGGEACLACVRHCPADALPAPADAKPRVLSVTGKPRTVAAVNLNRCTVAACGLRKEYGAPQDFCPKNPTDEELAHAFREKPINHFEGLDHYPKWRCDKCLLYCPAGAWQERFADRGLTRACDPMETATRNIAHTEYDGTGESSIVADEDLQRGAR